LAVYRHEACFESLMDHTTWCDGRVKADYNMGAHCAHKPCHALRTRDNAEVETPLCYHSLCDAGLRSCPSPCASAEGRASRSRRAAMCALHAARRGFRPCLRGRRRAASSIALGGFVDACDHAPSRRRTLDSERPTRTRCLMCTQRTLGGSCAMASSILHVTSAA
jgi:hypothetical protein